MLGVGNTQSLHQCNGNYCQHVWKPSVHWLMAAILAKHPCFEQAVGKVCLTTRRFANAHGTPDSDRALSPCCSPAVHKCGQAGLRVGQGTGFEFMVNPWLQYEAYGMKMTNNVIYDVWGAGLGVVGGYSVLVAHNSLYR